MKLNLRALTLVVCTALVTCATQASAATVAYTTVPTTETDLALYGLSGILFTPTLNIDLTEVGFTAISIGGGDTPQLTLWSVNTNTDALTQIYTTGNINSSVTNDQVYDPPTLPVPTSASYVSVGTPIELYAGQTYLLTAPAYWAATYASSDVTANAVLGDVSYVTTGPGNWSGWANSDYNLSDLTAASSSAVPAEANFMFNVDPDQSVPEPSTYALLGAGFALLLVRLRRRAVSAMV
jgi:hypothetical protein